MKEIKSYKYLKSETYYNNLYDRGTVEECRRIEKDFSKLEYKPKTKSNKKSKKKEIKVIVDLSPTPLYFIKGERYLKKAEIIRKWMERDEAQDEKLENTPPPQNILCPSCSSEMVVGMKDLQTKTDEDIDRVLFFFECPKCKKRKLIYENGEEWKPMPVICPKCENEMERKHKRKGNKVTTTYKCLKCDYKKTEVLDLDEKEEPKKEKIDPNFEKDHKRFCLSAEEGREYIESKAKLERVSEFLKESKEKEEIREKIAKIKKLNIAGLRKLLVPAIEKEGYIKLELSKPKIERDVIVKFTAQDDKVDRCEYDSIHNLRKIFKSALAETNWRLMSEGISYRLGILSGRLRGYENDEDLLRLINNKFC